LSALLGDRDAPLSRTAVFDANGNLVSEAGPHPTRSTSAGARVVDSMRVRDGTISEREFYAGLCAIAVLATILVFLAIGLIPTL
jgi:ketosteroid isomerase-like protein